jgi:hypothetical protein
MTPDEYAILIGVGLSVLIALGVVYWLINE